MTLTAKLLVLAGGVLLATSCLRVHAEQENPYAAWKMGPSKDPAYFPIAVWLQAPSNAQKYKDAGINLYVGLWAGPTEEQLTALKAAGMPVFCDQNKVGLAHKDDPIIVGWMHGDEPDNAQSKGKGKGYGPPITPEKIIEDYKVVREKDDTRPVMLNLGQGVAWDGWIGRGVRTNKPEDYPEYVKGGDIVSFDIYPGCHSHKDVAGNLWYVAKGVERLRTWTEQKKIIWCCIECTHISNPKAKSTPHQVKCEVWMAITHGATGLIYFSHQFKPKFIEAGLLADKEMTAAVTKINKQVTELAPVLNSPTVEGGVKVASDEKVPVHAMVKRHGGATYIFAVGMRDGTTKATFTPADVPVGATVEVIGEDRTLTVKDGAFADDFKPWDVHLYKIAK